MLHLDMSWCAIGLERVDADGLRGVTCLVIPRARSWVGRVDRVDRVAWDVLRSAR